MNASCGEEAALQSCLEAAYDGHPDERSPMASGPVGVLRDLESSRRFHRDTGLGRIFHPRMVTFRENVPTNSLHVLVDQNRISAHVDRVSPLGLRPEHPPRYSLRRAVAHNIAGMLDDLFRLALGREGDHRAELDCEWLGDPSRRATPRDHLLDPAASAWSVHLEARVAGALDEARLRSALAVLCRNGVDVDLLDAVDCEDDASLDSARTQLLSQAVAMNQSPPLRARLARHPGGDILMLNLNHAASDGNGALRVLRLVAQAYAGQAEPDPPPDFLATHDLPVRPASAPVSAPMARYHGGVERLRDLLARPARLARQDPSEDSGFGFHLVCLGADDTRRVINAERPGTSRNILMAALHLAIGDWNLQHDAPGRRIGVLVPVDLRPQPWPAELVGNFTVTTRVSTSRRHRKGPASALAAITSQTTRNRRIRTGTALVEALERAGLLPLWAQQSEVVLQPLTRNGEVDTAVLAHLGWVDEPPSFGADAGETVDLWFSVPARAPLTLCIGAVTVSGQLHLTFRYPRRLFSPDAARRFADCYLAQIRLVAEHSR